MSVLVRVGRKKAILCEAEWRSADRDLESHFQNMLELWIARTGGPPLSHKDPDNYAARALQPDLGFDITHNTSPKGRAARTAYLSKRQYRLPFH